MSKEWKNQLYFADNLDVLKQLYSEYPQGFIDVIYNDPPFNSKRNYNVLFESVDMKDTTAQKEAFADTWSNVSYMDTLNELSELDINLYRFLQNLDNTNISKGAISYLTTMSIRLWYMFKLLKDTGSFFLHCDPTMSHYLKIVCDLIFGAKNFRNEIIWHYKKWPSGYQQFQRNHDVIFFYTKTSSKKRTFVIDYMPRAESTLKRFGNKTIISGYDEDGERIPSETLDEESKGVPQDDVWNISRVPPIKQLYPTEKPEKLLERIIKASSKEGDIIADFFCGCGTTITVSQRLNRKWIGVDISHLAVRLIAKRLGEAYGDGVLKTFEIHGFPKDIAAARELANNVKGGRLEFEDWIIEVLLHGITNERRNEMGFDGYRTFNIYDKKYIVMIEVKSGNATPSLVNHFIKTVEDRKGAIGIFICFVDQITRNMQVIAKKEGQFTDDYENKHCDKIQIISVEDLLEGKRPIIPTSKFETFKKTEKKSSDNSTQPKLEL